MFLLVVAHPGCPGQNPDSRKTVVVVVVVVVHLGHVISAKMDDELDVKGTCCKFTDQANNFLCFFSSFNSVLRHSTTAEQVAMVWACAAKRRQ